MPVSTFSTLNKNDILFIDSTHVLKTASDVHYELFSILPSLNKGVLVHFHDIQYPFEYPRPWLFKDNMSWNEIYALRAFLMYNSAFEVVFWNGLFAHRQRELIHKIQPAIPHQPRRLDLAASQPHQHRRRPARSAAIVTHTIRIDRDKVDIVDQAFSSFGAQSFADLGAVSPPEGAYTSYALDKYSVQHAVLVDTEITPAVIDRAKKYPQLRSDQWKLRKPGRC